MSIILSEREIKVALHCVEALMSRHASPATVPNPLKALHKRLQSAGMSAEQEDAPDFISSMEIAELLGITDRGVRHILKRGEIPANYVAGRWIVRRDDAERFAHDYTPFERRDSREYSTRRAS